MKKTLRTIIISNILIISLLTASACSQPTDKNSGASVTEASQANTLTSALPLQSELGSDENDENKDNKDILTPEDIENCINRLSSELKIKDYAYEYDIDFDGKKELLCPFMGVLKIFKKNDNVISEKNAEGDGFHHAFDGLKTLQTFDDGKEKYSYFYYDYSGAVMTCKVLTAIKYNPENDMYIVKNLLSWGNLDYEGDASQFSRSFFRKGWNALDITVGESVDDISEEEFLEIYNKYQNLPPPDEFLNKE